MSEKKYKTLAEIFEQDFGGKFPFKAGYKEFVFDFIAKAPDGSWVIWDPLTAQASTTRAADERWTAVKPKKKIVIEAWSNRVGDIVWRLVGKKPDNNTIVNYQPTGITIERECDADT